MASTCLEGEKFFGRIVMFLGHLFQICFSWWPRKVWSGWDNFGSGMRIGGIQKERWVTDSLMSGGRCLLVGILFRLVWRGVSRMVSVLTLLLFLTTGMRRSLGMGSGRSHETSVFVHCLP